MATTKRRPAQGGLGQGLDSVFFENTAESGGHTLLRLTKIEPSASQPRKRFDEESLAALADSIRENGLLQPLVVRERENGYYEIIAGERRWRAAKLAGLREVPAVILDADDRKTAELALIENIQREDLDPVELAKGYERLMREFSLTQETVAKTVGRSRSAVANSLRLLELPEEVLGLVGDGALSEGHGKVLLSLREKAALPALAAYVAEKKLSVRETEQLVKRKNREAEAPEKEPRQTPEEEYLAQVERRVSERLGRIARIGGKKGARRLELSFEDDEDLEDLLRRLCGEDVFD